MERNKFYKKKEGNFAKFEKILPEIDPCGRMIQFHTSAWTIQVQSIDALLLFVRPQEVENYAVAWFFTSAPFSSTFNILIQASLTFDLNMKLVQFWIPNMVSLTAALTSNPNASFTRFALDCVIDPLSRAWCWTWLQCLRVMDHIM